MVPYECSFCGQPIEEADVKAGLLSQCPNCHQDLPGVEASAAASVSPFSARRRAASTAYPMTRFAIAVLPLLGWVHIIIAPPVLFMAGEVGMAVAAPIAGLMMLVWAEVLEMARSAVVKYLQL